MDKNKVFGIINSNKNIKKKLYKKKIKNCYLIKNKIYEIENIFSSNIMSIIKIDKEKIKKNKYIFNKNEILKLCSINSLDTNLFNDLNNLKYLDLSSNQLTNLNENLFKDLNNLETLDLSSNQLTILDKNVFNDLKKLEILYLSSNELKSLDENLFNELKKLDILYLSSNKFTSLKKNLFNNLNNLEYIDLSSNHIISLDENLFNDLKNLKYLFLNSNKLVNLDQNFFRVLNNLKYLDLSSNKLSNLDQNLFKDLNNLEQLDLSSNELTSLDQNLFKDLNNLKYVDLSSNELTTLDKNIFKSLKRLENLYLFSNQISRLDGNLFNDLECLNYLDLSSNQLTSLNENLFNVIIYLKSLVLSSNKLTNLDQNLFKYLNNLERLDLSSNQLTILDHNLFKDLNNLERLDLSSNQLTSLNENLFNYLKNLKYLFLNSNKLVNLDQNFFRVINNLKYLDLSLNKFTSLDQNLFNDLRNLKYLFLNSNKLVNLDQIFFRVLNNLKYLDLSSNKLSNLDQNLFKDLNNLEQLDLSSNELTSLDQNLFKDLNNLKYLDLCSNELTSMDQNFFKDLNNLERLDLCSNQLTSLGEYLFNDLESLNYLDLSSNQLTSLNENLFNVKNNLKSLDLSSNKLTNLDQNFFRVLNNLKYLDLSSNKLSNLDQNLFKDLNNLETLDLSSNQLISFDQNLFKYLNNLEQLDLSSNQFKIISFFVPLSLNKLFLFFNNLEQCNIFFYNLFNSDFVNYKCSKFNILIDARGNKFSKFIIFNHLCLKNNSNYFSIDSNISSSLFNFQIDFRFNKFSDISCTNDFFSNLKLNLNIDLRNNYFDFKIIDRFSNTNGFKIEANIILKFKDSDQDIRKLGYLQEIYFINPFFDFSHLNKFYKWQDIPMLSVITGKNGFGKSTLLSFIEKYLNEKFIDTTIYPEDILNEDKISCPIAVLLKLHSSIESNTQRLDEINNILDDHKTNNGISVLSVYNLQSAVMFLANRLESLNDHLKKNKFKYKINKVDKENKKIMLTADLSEPNRLEIYMEKLSPGEQLILLLNIWEYILTRFPFKHKFVLLLDEPDAHLHPKAVYEFISILKKVCFAGAQVIMTTHNPTTASFIDPANLFVIREKSIDGELKYKIEKGVDDVTEIITELTDGLVVVNLPFKVINVEGLLDEVYYKWIIDTLNKNFSRLKSQILIEKLRSYDNKRGCHAIRSIIRYFLDGHKLNHFGIIDNDNYHLLCHNSQDELKKYYKLNSSSIEKPKRVLNTLRYSVENYILDPIYFYLYLKDLDKTKSEQTWRKKYFDGVETIDNDYKKYLNDIDQLLNEFAHKLWNYLKNYNWDTFSYEIFSKINKESIIYKLVDIFYLWENSKVSCSFNSIDFAYQLLNNSENLANTYEKEITTIQNSDINIFKLDKNSTIDEIKKLQFYQDLESCIASVKEKVLNFENTNKKSELDKLTKLEQDLLSNNIIIKTPAFTNNNKVKVKLVDNKKDLNKMEKISNQIKPQYKINDKFFLNLDSQTIKKGLEALRKKEINKNDANRINDFCKKMKRIVFNEKIEKIEKIFINEFFIREKNTQSAKKIKKNANFNNPIINEVAKSFEEILSKDEDFKTIKDFLFGLIDQLHYKMFNNGKHLQLIKPDKHLLEEYFQEIYEKNQNKKEFTNLNDIKCFLLWLIEETENTNKDSQSGLENLKKILDPKFKDCENFKSLIETDKNQLKEDFQKIIDSWEQIDVNSNFNILRHFLLLLIQEKSKSNRKNFFDEADFKSNIEKILNSFENKNSILLGKIIHVLINLIKDTEPDNKLDFIDLKKILNGKFKNCNDLKSVVQTDKDQLKRDLNEILENTQYEYRSSNFQTMKDVFVKLFTDLKDQNSSISLTVIDLINNKKLSEKFKNCHNFLSLIQTDKDSLKKNLTTITSRNKLNEDRLNDLNAIKILLDFMSVEKIDEDYIKNDNNLNENNLENCESSKRLDSLFAQIDRNRSVILDENEKKINLLKIKQADFQSFMNNLNFIKTQVANLKSPENNQSEKFKVFVKNLEEEGYIENNKPNDEKIQPNQSGEKLKKSLEDVIKKSEIFDEYVELKKKIDDELINIMEKQLIKTTINCHYVDSEPDFFVKYPLIFYRLRGHSYEFILHQIFTPEKEYKEGDLSNQVFEKIVKTSGRFIPLEMKQIFKTIDEIIKEQDNKIQK